MNTAIAIFVGVWVGVGPAWAMLGQPWESVFSDQQHLQAHLRTAAHTGYSVQQLEVVDGTVVREYVSPAGLVFGIAWQGPKVPDLAQLLGVYFSAYQDAMQSTGRPRGPWAVHTGSLVVEMRGHPRAFSGRAYLLSLVPSHLSSEVIQ